MQDAVTLFSSSKLEHENAALKAQITEIDELKKDYAILNRMVAELMKQQAAK